MVIEKEVKKGRRGERTEFSEEPLPAPGPAPGTVSRTAAGRDGLMASRPLGQSRRTRAGSARLHGTGCQCSRERNQQEGNSETAAWKAALAVNSVHEMNPGQGGHAPHRPSRHEQECEGGADRLSATREGDSLGR